MINVSTEIKARVEAEAKVVCARLKIKVQDFNQEANAITAARVLKGMGVSFPEDAENPGRIAPDVMMVLKKMGNASALRQAIDPNTAKKTTAAANLSDEAAALLEE